MSWLAIIAFGLGGVVVVMISLNIVNIVQAGSKRADGRTMREILGVDPEKATFDDVERLSRKEKMQLFYAAQPIDMNELAGEYAARLLSGGVLGPSSAYFTHHFFPTGAFTAGTRWVGKAFAKNGASSGWGYNIFTQKKKGADKTTLRIRKMNTNVGPTKIGRDGKPSLHLDYSSFNKGAVRSMRDELRKINGNLYIGAGHMALGGGALNPAPFALIGPATPWVGADGE